MVLREMLITREDRGEDIHWRGYRQLFLTVVIINLIVFTITKCLFFRQREQKNMAGNCPPSPTLLDDIQFTRSRPRSHV